MNYTEKAREIAERWVVAPSPLIAQIATALQQAHEAGRKEGEAHKLRLFDLVRYQRAELHEAGLITDKEYAEIASANGSRERLETYDELRATISTLEDRIKVLEGIVREIKPATIDRGFYSVSLKQLCEEAQAALEQKGTNENQD